MNCGVYLIENLRDGRKYVGSSVDLRKRFREHLRQLTTGKHHSRFLQRCWDKYGQDAFVFRVLLHCAPKDVIYYEQRAIDTLKPEYNVVPVAGSQLGYRHSEESRRKMSASRRKDFSPMTGRKHTEETKRKISENRRGKGGGGWTDDRRKRISEALKGRHLSPEARLKISERLRGQVQSAETIAKRVAKLRGRKMPQSVVEATRQRMLGTKMSPESIAKMARTKSSLSEEQVRTIRDRVRSGIRRNVIARELGMNPSHISNIVRMKSYAWVN